MVRCGGGNGRDTQSLGLSLAGMSKVEWQQGPKRGDGEAGELFSFARLSFCQNWWYLVLVPLSAQVLACYWVVHWLSRCGSFDLPTFPDHWASKGEEQWCLVKANLKRGLLLLYFVPPIRLEKRIEHFLYCFVFSPICLLAYSPIAFALS